MGPPFHPRRRAKRQTRYVVEVVACRVEAEWIGVHLVVDDSLFHIIRQRTWIPNASRMNSLPDSCLPERGKVVEQGPAAEIFTDPQADYTKTLLEAALNLKAA